MTDPEQLIKRIEKEDKSDWSEELKNAARAWIKQIEDAQLIKSFREAFFTEFFIKRLEGYIASIERELLHKREITELERLNLMDRRDLYAEFIGLLNTDSVIQSVEHDVNENL